MSDLKTFISDNVVRVSISNLGERNQLIRQILGSSDSATVDFVHSLALSSKTPGDLYHALLGVGLTDSPDSQSFASQVHSLVPRKVKAKVAKPVSAVNTQKFSLLLDDEAESSTSKRKKEKKRDKGKENVADK